MKSLMRASLALLVMLMVAGTVAAQDTELSPEEKVATLGRYPGEYAAMGMGLSVVGIGIGVGLIGFAALSGIARQPEQAGRIQGAMILLAALVEGAGVIAIIFCAFVVA